MLEDFRSNVLKGREGKVGSSPEAYIDPTAT